jgi:hypothetical protein
LQADTIDDLNSLLYILGDPIFRDCENVYNVIEQLSGQLQQHPSILPADFDIVPTTGELILNVSRNSYDPEFDEQRGELREYLNHTENQINYSLQFHQLKSRHEVQAVPNTMDTHQVENNFIHLSVKINSN